MLSECDDCGTLFAYGLDKCPHCGSMNYHTHGDLMPKNTRSGASNAAVDTPVGDAPDGSVDTDDQPEPEVPVKKAAKKTTRKK